MSQQTGIEWTDATWNPIRGCSRVSDGCRFCYAELVAARFSGPGQPYEGLARRRSNGEPQWTGEVRVIEEHMNDPLRWRKPRRVFVNSMSDLFHENIADETLDRIFGVMELARRHSFQVLTKRPGRALAYLTRPGAIDRIYDTCYTGSGKARASRIWPLPNVWLGVSVEHQAAADERIPLLLQMPAAVRFLSCEPLLGPVDILESIRVLWREVGAFHPVFMQPGGIDWVIAGGESGPGARPCDVQWIRAIVEQCREKDVPVFVKQLGSEPGFKLEDEERRGNTMPSFHHAIGDLCIKKLRDRKGGDPDEWPEDLRVREMPDSAVAA